MPVARLPKKSIFFMQYLGLLSGSPETVVDIFDRSLEYLHSRDLQVSCNFWQVSYQF